MPEGCAKGEGAPPGNHEFQAWFTTWAGSMA